MVVEHERRTGPPGGAGEPADVRRRLAPVLESAVQHDHHDAVATAQRGGSRGQRPFVAANRAALAAPRGDVGHRLVIARDRGAARERDRLPADANDRRPLRLGLRPSSAEVTGAREEAAEAQRRERLADAALACVEQVVVAEVHTSTPARFRACADVGALAKANSLLE